MMDTRTNDAAVGRQGQEAQRKLPGTERKTAHRSPNVVMPTMRQMIVGSVRAGRSVAQTAREYDVTQACVLELVLRSSIADVSRRLERLEDAVLSGPAIARAA